MSKLTRLFLAIACISTFTYCAFGFSQDPEEPEYNQLKTNRFHASQQWRNTPGQAVTIKRPLASSTDRFPGGNSASPLSQSIQKLKDAEDDDQKEETMDEIREILEGQYDSFLESNSQQIDQLQDRIDQLKDQLERRRRAKSRMIDLELERVVNESQGLVWPSQGRKRSGRGRSIFGLSGTGEAARPAKLRSVDTVPSPSHPFGNKPSRTGRTSR